MPLTNLEISDHNSSENFLSNNPLFRCSSQA
jgi:hypothetical protein